MSRPRRDHRRLSLTAAPAISLAAALALVACSHPSRNDRSDRSDRSDLADRPSAPPSADAAAQEPTRSQETAFGAVVREYTPNAMRSTDDNGGVTVFHSVRLELTSPPRFAGRDLLVFHDRDIAPDSPWRREGAAVRFHAVESRLKANTFAGAIGDLTLK